jgi:hypothetical protein
VKRCVRVCGGSLGERDAVLVAWLPGCLAWMDWRANGRINLPILTPRLLCHPTVALLPASALPAPATALQVKQEVDLPFWVPYLASSLTFGGGLLGISYGIMSGGWAGSWVAGRCWEGKVHGRPGPVMGLAVGCRDPASASRCLLPFLLRSHLTPCPAPACPAPPPSAASWEPRREGSFLGWTEFQANVPLLLERFKRK